MTEPVLHVLADPSAAVAELLAAQAARAGTIVLTGGGSVAAAYGQAAAREPDWHRAELWWSDERCVPPDDERSNYGLVRRTLLERLQRQPDVQRIKGELAPHEAARDYDERLAGVALDLLLLGLGSDGHIASLFPGSPQLRASERRATSGPAGLEPFVERVTMTLRSLRSAGRIVFLVSGEAKAPALERAFRGPVSDELPASLLREGDSPIDVFCDRAAARLAVG